MSRWEYSRIVWGTQSGYWELPDGSSKTIYGKSPDEIYVQELLSYLNAAGAQGWEVVSEHLRSDLAGAGGSYLLKRPI